MKIVSMCVSRGVRNTYEETPHGPEGREHDQAGSHSSLDELKLLLGSNPLGDQNTSTI